MEWSDGKKKKCRPIEVRISRGTAMPAIIHNGQQHVKFKFLSVTKRNGKQITVNEMKSARKLFPFLSVAYACMFVCERTITKRYTHSQPTDTGSLFYCVSWAWLRHLIVSLFILIWLERVVAAAAAAAEPAHLRHTFISTNMFTDLFERQSQRVPASLTS